MTTNKTRQEAANPALHTRPTSSRRPIQLAESSVYLVAAHGGCGVTTLAAHAFLRSLVRETSVSAVAASVTDERLVCVVVAAGTADGTARAVRTLHQLERAGFPTHRLRLVLLRDGRGPMPVAARARVRLLSTVVEHIDVLPHVQRWRYESGTRKTRSRRYDRAVERLAVDLHGSTPRGRTLPMDDVHFHDDDLPDRSGDAWGELLDDDRDDEPYEQELASTPVARRKENS